MERLPEPYASWDELGRVLPGLIAAGRVRETFERVPIIDPAGLSTRPEQERALGLLSTFGHAAVHEHSQRQAAGSIPASIAVPWAAVARALERYPVLTYCSHGLNNWRRLDPDGPVALGNLAVLRNMSGEPDEDWFVATHVDIEAKAVPLVEAVPVARAAVVAGAPESLERALGTVADAVESCLSSLPRIRERCDPQVFFDRVQPFMQGIRSVVYEGVAAFEGRPQTFPGASGAQSALLPLLDAMLGVAHAPDALITYLVELRRYMPVEDQAFLDEVERGPSIRGFALERRERNLTEQYNRCLDGLERFRMEHLQISLDYIQRPARLRASARGEHGTGGSPFVSYLKKHCNETRAARIQGG